MIIGSRLMPWPIQCTAHAVFTHRRATQTSSATYFRHIPELRDEMTCPFETCLPLFIWVKQFKQMLTINLTQVAAYGGVLRTTRDPSQQFGEAREQVSQEQPSAEKHSSWRLWIIQMHRFEAEEAPTTKHKQRSNHFRASPRCEPVPHLCTDDRLGLEHKKKICCRSIYSASALAVAICLSLFLSDTFQY